MRWCHMRGEGGGVRWPTLCGFKIPPSALLCLLLLILAVSSRAAAIHGPSYSPQNKPQPLLSNQSLFLNQPLVNPLQRLTNDKTMKNKENIRTELSVIEVNNEKMNEDEIRLNKIMNNEKTNEGDEIRLNNEGKMVRTEDEKDGRMENEEKIRLNNERSTILVNKMKNEDKSKKNKEEKVARLKKEGIVAKLMNKENTRMKNKDGIAKNNNKVRKIQNKMENEAKMKDEEEKVAKMVNKKNKRMNNKEGIAKIEDNKEGVTRIRDIFTTKSMVRNGRIKTHGTTIASDHHTSKTWDWCGKKRIEPITSLHGEVEKGMPDTLRRHIPKLALQFIHNAKKKREKDLAGKVEGEIGMEINDGMKEKREGDLAGKVEGMKEGEIEMEINEGMKGKREEDLAGKVEGETGMEINEGMKEKREEDLAGKVEEEMEMEINGKRLEKMEKEKEKNMENRERVKGIEMEGAKIGEREEEKETKVEAKGEKEEERRKEIQELEEKRLETEKLIKEAKKGEETKLEAKVENEDPKTQKPTEIKPKEISESTVENANELTLPKGCQFVGRMDLKTVVCSGPNITIVPSFPLARQVESLHFSNTGIQMVTNVSGLPRSLKALAFTEGNLAIFDGSKLYQLPDLSIVSLDDNSLTSWSFGTFLSSTPASITYLSVANNLITYPPDPSGGVSPVLPMLDTVIMSDNPMWNLPGKLFQPLVNSPVTLLSLNNCSIAQFYGSPLEPVKGLKFLDLSSNMGLSPTELTELLTPLKDGNLTELYLANNNYGSVPTDALALVGGNLEVLDLHGSAFECLDNTSFPVMPRLLTLNLKYCRINSIRQDTFLGFPVLEVLHLDGNGLVTIPTEVLLPSLKVLTLSENPRSTGNGSPESFTIDKVDFTSMTSLTNLTFQQVPLGGVEVTYFNDLTGLLELRLTACNIAYIQPFSFVNLSLLERLHLDQNELRALSNHTFTGLVSLLFLDLSGNTIIFHSNIDYSILSRPQPLIIYPNENKPLENEVVSLASSKLDHILAVPHAVFKWLRGTEVKEMKNGGKNEMTGVLSVSDVDSENGGKYVKNGGKLETENVDDNLKRGNMHKKGPDKGIRRESRFDMNEKGDIGMINGSRGSPHIYLPFQGLISLVHLDISDNEVWMLSPELWHDLGQLVTLDLDSNDIQEWQEPVFGHLSNLKNLILSKNSLNSITEAMVEDFSIPSLAMIDLRYNPFQCSCPILSFNDTLNTSVFVEYPTYRCSLDEDIFYFSDYIASNTTCSDEKEVPHETPPSENIMNVQILIITVSITMSVLMASVTIYRKRWYIRYIVHTARMRTMTYKDDDHTYIYDIFVCYSQADRQWVFEHLVAKLEDGGKYRVCVHERDFTVGQEITDNIIASVERSRKVVMVLSPDFIESSWCMFELQLASNKILDERKNKLILILLTQLPSENQPKKLRLLLRTRTYLEWMEDSEGQKLFWVRLMRTVAKPSMSENIDAATYL